MLSMLLVSVAKPAAATPACNLRNQAGGQCFACHGSWTTVVGLRVSAGPDAQRATPSESQPPRQACEVVQTQSCGHCAAEDAQRRLDSFFGDLAPSRHWFGPPGVEESAHAQILVRSLTG
jgi:hypothetical protein